jgi:Tfp pilus assembly protein PilF
MLALAATLLASSGCAQFRPSWPSLTKKSPPPNYAQESRPPKELPAHRAAEVCLTTAQQLEAAGKEIEAIQQYERARHFQPALALPTHRLAILYDRTGDARRAEQAFATALRMSPKDADLHNDWGFFLASQQRWPEAEAAYRRALALQPNNQRATTNLALALAEQGRYADAFALFAQVSGPAAAHSNLGVLLARQGREAQARDAFRQALAADPHHGHARQFLAALDSQSSSSVQPAAHHQREAQPLTR